MGNIIVNWSPIHGQSATTSNTVALASIFSLEHPYYSLLTHTQESYSTMESMFKKRNKDGISDSGVLALERLAKSNLLSPQAVSDYTETIYRSSLDFLPGKNNEHTDSESGKLIQSILRAAARQYDLLWIDAHSGTANKKTVEMLKLADLIVVHLPQNKYILEQFFNSGMPTELKGRPFIIVISMYDDQAGYSLRNIKRQFHIKEPILSVPYLTGFRDAANQESVSEYFIRTNNARKGDPSFMFLQSVRSINDEIKKHIFAESKAGSV